MLANALVISGMLILAVSLLPVRGLIAQLPTGSLRHFWYTMMLLIALFIAGYASYLSIFWQHDRYNDLHDLIVPVIFFCGSVFVWLSSTLSLRTAMDLRRMSLLEHESITDPLLGIYNRRYLDRRLPNEIARAKRYGQQLSLLMVDIDHFKQVNDRYGHQAGDLVLSFVAKLILDAIRETDIAARYGGEEIVIVAPNSDGETAGRLAERLRRVIETHELTLAGEGRERQAIRITVSIGVAELGDRGLSGKGLIDRSDRAMYRAKEAGRNRVMIDSGDAAE